MRSDLIHELNENAKPREESVRAVVGQCHQLPSLLGLSVNGSAAFNAARRFAHPPQSPPVTAFTAAPIPVAVVIACTTSPAPRGGFM
jgi:hypothetical protein